MKLGIKRTAANQTFYTSFEEGGKGLIKIEQFWKKEQKLTIYFYILLNFGGGAR